MLYFIITLRMLYSKVYNIIFLFTTYVFINLMLQIIMFKHTERIICDLYNISNIV